jgi:hypothetical protein
MADIDQILAGGAGASTRADFSGIGKLPENYWKGRDEFAKTDLRDAFKDGVPLTPDGQPDFGAMAKTLMQKGGLDQGIAASNVDLQRQKLRYGQDVDAQVSGGPTPRPQGPIVSPPSMSRGASVQVAPALAKGGAPPQGQAAVPQGSSQGDQPGSIVGMVSAAGVPDELAGPIIQQVSAATRSDPNAAVNPQMAPRVQQIVAEAVKRSAAANQPQPQAAQPQPAQPQVAPVQQQPAQGADPRFVGLVPNGRTPEQQIQLLSRAISSGAIPVEQAKLYQNRIDAITKAMEPTAGEKDFNAATRNPKLDDYVAQQEAAKASAKGVAEQDVKEQGDLIAQGKQASSRLTTLNTMSNIISSDPNINLGFGGPTALKVKMALESLGVPVPDLSGPQAIQKLNASLASEMAKSLTSRTTQFEFKTFLGNNPGLELDKSGNERLIGIFSQLAKRDVDLGKLARQNRDNWNNWDQVVENYDKQNPMRDPVTKKVLSTDSIIAPGPGKSTPSSAPMTFGSPSEVHAAVAAGKLKSGDPFKTSDGRTKYVP